MLSRRVDLQVAEERSGGGVGDRHRLSNEHLARRESEFSPNLGGQVRHLKRLWLATEALEERPPYFERNPSSHWGSKRTVSRLTPN